MKAVSSPVAGDVNVMPHRITWTGWPAASKSLGKK